MSSETLESSSLLGDRYRLGELLGRGGMGSVYRAEDEMLGRVVAVKIFSDDASSGGTDERKRSEMRLLASLNHPALITVFDANIDAKPHAYLVMEFVDGPTLHEKLRAGPLTPTETASMAKTLGVALSVVHAAGVIHRDIKPSNVLLTTQRGGGALGAKLADFGIATILDATPLTVPGTLMGTAAYLAPEQLNASAPAPAADIYSFGLVLLECVTGTRAFPGTAAESMSARLASDPVMPQSVPVALRPLLVAMTARDPSRRPSADEVVELAEIAERELLSEQSSDALATMPTVADTGQHETRVLTMPTEATVLIPHGVRDQRDVPDQRAVPDRRDVPDRPRRRVLVGAVVGVGVLAAALSIGLLTQASDTPASTPELPATDAPLDAHLADLLEAVSP